MMTKKELQKFVANEKNFVEFSKKGCENFVYQTTLASELVSKFEITKGFVKGLNISQNALDCLLVHNQFYIDFLNTEIFNAKIKPFLNKKISLKKAKELLEVFGNAITSEYHHINKKYDIATFLTYDQAIKILNDNI